MKRPLVWLSLDFDFFVRELGGWGFDHGSGEHYTIDIWAQRERVFRACRQNIRREMSLRHADPHPNRFWRALERLGYRFDKLRRIVVADSHGFAYRAFDAAALDGRAPADVHIVHVDAHHDLFYSVDQLEQSAGLDEPTCENWLLFTLMQHRGLHARIVYPRWKGFEEWDASFGRLAKQQDDGARSITDWFRKRVSPCLWGSGTVRAAAGDVGTLFIAKSSPWVPPWLDAAFARFCTAASARYGVELSLPYIDEEGVNPLLPRLPLTTRNAA